MYQEIDENANKIENGNNNYTIYNNLINLGYKHKGFNKLYEGNQPRYTFRTYYKQFENFDEVEKTFSKSFARPIKRSYNYDLEVYQSDEIKTFHDLIKIISKRDGFNEYSLDYYQNVYNELKKQELIKVFNVKINPSHLIEKFENELAKEKNEDRKVKLQKDIDYFKEIAKECAQIIGAQKSLLPAEPQELKYAGYSEAILQISDWHYGIDINNY